MIQKKIQKHTEQETTPEKFFETEKTDDAVMTSDSEDAVDKEDYVLEERASKP